MTNKLLLRHVLSTNQAITEIVNEGLTPKGPGIIEPSTTWRSDMSSRIT